MDRDTQLIFGKMLGEIYRLHRKLGVPTEDKATVYGLTHGVADLVVEHLGETLEVVPEGTLHAVIDVLQPIYNDQAKLDAFKGYYDIENELKTRGVDRGSAIRCLTILKARGQFASVIDKMDSTDSPSECRTFDLPVL